MIRDVLDGGVHLGSKIDVTRLWTASIIVSQI